MNDPSSAQTFAGLVRVHLALRRGLDIIERGPGDRDLLAWGRLADIFAIFLLRHHEGEDHYIFPFLRDIARARPGDEKLAGLVEFLDHKSTEHETVHHLCERLQQGARALVPGASPDAVMATARELKVMLLPHLDEEEATLNFERLGHAVPARELEDIKEKMVAADRRAAGPRALMYFVHSLTAEEQRAHFGDMPWILRKVLIGVIWARAYRSLISLTYNPRSAL